MNEIVVCADVHEGINFPYLIDPETGISARALDIHQNLIKVAEFAIKEKAKLFVILGDLFDRTQISPTYSKMVREDIIEPLGKADVKVWLIAGNHDQPKSFKKGSPTEEYFVGFPHVKVYRKPTVEKLELKDKKILFLIVPYLWQEQLMELVKEKLDKDIPTEQALITAQRIIKNWLETKSAETSGAHKILLAHYYIEGARLTETNYSSILPGELAFKKDMIPSDLDMAVFGHVHFHQNMGKKGNAEIIYVGAPEKIDWGERNDAKGFVAISPLERTWKFIELPTRKFEKLRIEIADIDEATDKILNSIPDVKDKMLRIEIVLPVEKRAVINENKLTAKLNNAFHYELIWIEKTAEEKLAIEHFTTDPYMLLENFVLLTYSKHPKKDKILELGREIIAEALE